MFDANAETTLSIPRPQQGLTPFKVNMALAYEGERHIREIATASSGNALHLASIFARAYDSLSRVYGSLLHEAGLATIDARKRRARIILDLAPAKVKEKGLAGPRSPNGSEDVREAICYDDTEYCAIEQYRAALEAASELVQIKLRAMWMAHEDVRALVKGTSGSAGNGVHATGQASEGGLMDRARDLMERAEQDDLMERVEQVETEQIRKANQADDETMRRLDEQARPPRGFGKPTYR